ncbi:MAG: fructuronate reductase [Candidatus Poribacteria bacterium]|nr:fructuronate reductase [Candidatus Poribacteria bacterium]
MLILTRDGIKNHEWSQLDIRLPEFNIPQMIDRTKSAPKWIHIAPSNIARSMIAPIQQKLIESGVVDYGMIAIETHDIQIIEDIYCPHDNLSIRVIMYPDGKNDLMVVGSIADAIFADNTILPDGWKRALDYFSMSSLQMVSITCTEKGYDINNLQAETDLVNGPNAPTHIMAKIASFAYHRYKNIRTPIAFVSMDNCAENGLKFFNAVMTFAREWVNRSFVENGFMDYLEKEVSFPWTMIDRITPRPAPEVKEMLEGKGIKDMEIITTEMGTVIAPFVNTEHVSYLVIEDKFPNGRPPLEKAGVIFCDSSEEVALYEKMKVGACLNPNQTTLAIFGCLLNYKHIYDAIADPLLKELVYLQSYEETLPVVIHPGKIDPKEFLREVLEERLPNPNIPDTPARIITDTSQKLGARYGNTIIAHGDNARNLKYIPLVIAGWCRYLMGVDDNGQDMNYNPKIQTYLNKWSPDPRLEELVKYISPIQFGRPETVRDRLKPILSDANMFGIDLYKTGVGENIERYFKEMIAEVDAVKGTLNKYLFYNSGRG